MFFIYMILHFLNLKHLIFPNFSHDSPIQHTFPQWGPIVGTAWRLPLIAYDISIMGYDGF